MNKLPAWKTPDSDALMAEASHIHGSLFGTDAPASLLADYARAHHECREFAGSTKAERRSVDIVLDKRLDVAAIGRLLTSGADRHLLTRKLLLVSYLAECDGKHPDFRREVRGWLPSMMQAMVVGAFGIVRMVRAKIQIAVHGIV